MNNVDEQFASDDLFPSWRHPTNSCHPYVEQPQDSLDHPHFSSPPFLAPEWSAAPVVHLPYGSLHTPTAMETVDLSIDSSPGSCQSQWSGMGPSLTQGPQQSVSLMHSQYQMPHEPLCGWSRDFEPLPVPLDIPSISQSLPPTVNHTHPGAGQYDAYMHYLLGGVDTPVSSPHGDTGLSASGSPGAFADYGYTFDTRVDRPRSSIAWTRDNMTSIPSTFFSSGEPTYGPDCRDRRYFGCLWLTNGTTCDIRVMADRPSIVEHLQHAHGMKPGEEKARQTCLWQGCTRSMNKESLARHILTVHLKEGVHCHECGVSFAREDSLKRHLKGGQHKCLPTRTRRDGRHETRLE